MIAGEIFMQVKFIVANVQSPLIGQAKFGLPDMDYNEIADSNSDSIQVCTTQMRSSWKGRQVNEDKVHTDQPIDYWRGK
eukprot:5721673-Amphidinium_carterae.1